jgi:hypothetical protein
MTWAVKFLALFVALALTPRVVAAVLGRESLNERTGAVWALAVAAFWSLP